MFQLSVIGGLRGPSPLDFPQLSLYGDGRLVMPGPESELYPGPMLPTLQFRHVSPAGIQRLLVLARDVGLMERDANFDGPSITDAPTTVFVVVANGARRVVSAYALGLGSDGESDPARAALLAFRNVLGDLDALLGPEIGPTEPYGYERLQILVQPDGPIPDQDVTLEPWPLRQDPATIGDPFPYGEGARCVVVSGDELRALEPTLREADELTRWFLGDMTYEFRLRPLLPDEAECSDAFGQPGRGR